MRNVRPLIASALFLFLFADSGRVFADDIGTLDEATGMTNSNYDGSLDGARVSNANYTGNVPPVATTFNTTSDPVNFSSADYAVGRAPSTKYGMFYLIWHCLAGGDHYNVYTNLGPPLTYNWHGMPSLGYYCPLENRDVLRTHAAQLRDAGIDFVFVDLTNFDGSEDAANLGAMAPLQALFEEWNVIPGAPKIVPWMPFRNGGILPAFVDNLYNQYPNMGFIYQGRPLWLNLWDAIHTSDPNLLAMYGSKYTLRTETIMSPNPGEWDFIPFCQQGFRESGGTIPCKQKVGNGPDGNVEQIAVTSAYQETLASFVATAVPKFDGRTFLQQMARMDDFPEPPLVMITGWNEWIAVRYCQINNMPTADCVNGAPTLPDGRPVFVDQYDDNYNRDLEPGGGYGDKYYQMVVNEVYGRKKARTQMIGYVDTVIQNGDGSATVTGWACSSGYNTSVQVELYANGVSGVGELVASGTANAVSEEPVGLMCQDGWQGTHRFALPVSSEQMRRYASQAVYVRGISPVGKPNFMLANSGALDFSGHKTGSSDAILALQQALTPIYRFRSATTNKHFYTANFGEGMRAGYVSEGQAFSLLPAGTAGTTTIYRCNANGVFISSDPGCEGQVKEGALGGVLQAQVPGTFPIYRMLNTQVSDHLQTTNVAEGLANGYVNEGPLGFAAP